MIFDGPDHPANATVESQYRFTEAEDAALDAIEGTHAAHDEEPDPECADCQERRAESWYDVMRPY